MKMLLAGASVLALLVPVCASADTKPETYVIKDGSFSCKTCTPAFTVKADGKAYPVKGAAFDAVARRVEASPKGANPVSGSWQVVDSSGAKLNR